jgi:hypothetical protein
MGTPADEPKEKPHLPRDAANWAAPIKKFKVDEVPAGAINLNLDGRVAVGPMQGFGRLWQRTYRIKLTGCDATPAQVIQNWKENFAVFQPSGNHFYPTLDGIKPGEILFIDAKLPVIPGLPGILPIAAGVMVFYADDESFSVMTPQGFPVSAWNTFSAYREDEVTVAQVQCLVRASDPIYEFGFRFMGGQPQEDKIWFYVLRQLAAHWGATGQVEFQKKLLDPDVQWRYAKDIWQNAAIRTAVYMVASPVRWVSQKVSRKNKS